MTATDAEPNEEQAIDNVATAGAAENHEEESGGDGTPSLFDSEVSEFEAFTLPEDMEMDSAALEFFTPAMQELKLDQESAQGLVSKFAAFREQEANTMKERQEAQRAEHLKAVQDDPVLGGSGMRDTTSRLNRVMKQPGGADVNALLRTYGLDNHPTIVRFVAGLGAQMSEDSLVIEGDRASHPERSIAEKMFGKTEG